VISISRAGVGTTVSSTEIEDDSIVNADVKTTAAIAYAKLASLTSAHLLVGSSGNVATDTAVTGDVTIGNTGVTAIGAGKLTAAMHAAGVLTTVIGNAQTANYTLVLTDAGKAVEMSNASGRTITVPPNASVAFPVDTVIEVVRMGAGTVTLVPGAAVTIRSAGGLLDISAQYAGATLRQRAADEWVLNGSLA
jgi:hypothetical protein